MDTPVSQLPFVGPNYVQKLAKLNIKTVFDLFYHFPFRYEDYSKTKNISDLFQNETVTVCASVLNIKNIYTKNAKKMTEAEIIDDTGKLTAVWFNQHYLTRVLIPGNKYNFSGTVGFWGKKISLISPKYELYSPNSIHSGRIVPVYPETEGLSSKWLRTRIYDLLTHYLYLCQEIIPSVLIKKYQFLELKSAIRGIHFPKTIEEAESCRQKLAFDELFVLQLSSACRKKQRENQKTEKTIQVFGFKDKLEKLRESLSFELTEDQDKTLKEIFSDFVRNYPMNRLLVGDVGSGKTIVAAITMYLAYLNGLKSVLMAPTEILAVQHHETIKNLLNRFGLKIELFTGSQTNTKNEKNIDVYIGTHSLLNSSIQIPNLGLVVIDEQQRFGVEQRTILQKKGANPHLLTMTATPIPRTAALALYGEVDLSVINQMPKGRQKVKTWYVPEEKRLKAYEWIKKNGKQIFFVCPLIDESETLASVKSAKAEFQKLQTIFEHHKLVLLHGQMKSKEKEKILQDFRKGKYQILVTTPVVEVGIDIPEADIMVIEGAERFGLSQLHQMRGRVGRNNQQAYCLLFSSETISQDSIKRLRFLEKCFSGPKLAEYDLQLRGFGEIFGNKQHGLVSFKAARLSDRNLLEKAKETAQNIVYRIGLNTYPHLQKMISQKNPEYKSGN